MKKLAIISSYDDLCGNASYTKALEKELSNYYDVTVISLNIELLRKGDPKIARMHIEKICEELKSFDYVNIQFEAGLFGSDIRQIKKRFFAVASACKKAVVTMHRFQTKDKYPGLAFLGKSLLRWKLKPFVREFLHAYANNKGAPIYSGVIKYCKKRRFPIIVHTQRDRKLIETQVNYDLVFDHPLCFYNQAYMDSIREVYTRADFCQNFSLDENKTYIGIFGFISRYKGYETVIKALQFLPENYELLIVGTQHPHTITTHESINEYVDSLLGLISSMNLTHRVKFHRALNDDDFVRALLRCDYNVLPYLEVKQGGSAIAALSLETNSKTIFSQNFAFFELEKYAPGSFKMFTIGNHLELANAILGYRPSNYASCLNEYHKKYNIHTSGELYKRLYAP